MQVDPATIAALEPRLVQLAEMLDDARFDLPAPGQSGASNARSAIIRTIREYLIPRFDDPEAPVVAAFVGPAGTGKSTIVNSLANDRISEVGPLRPTTRKPVLWAHRDHAGRYWSEFVARVRERVGPEIEVVIGDDELTLQLTVVDTPPSEYVTPTGKRPALDALALADLCVFVTSSTRYADAAAWDFLDEVRWRGVPMLFVLNRLPSDRDVAIALLNDFATRLHSRGLLLQPDAAMVFGVTEAVGDRWHGGLDPNAVGALRNELGAVSNSAYRKTLVETTAYTTGRNLVDRTRLVIEEMRIEGSIASELDKAVVAAYDGQLREIESMLVSGGLADTTRHKNWASAAVDLTAIVTRRAGVAAQETARSWTHDPTGARLLEGEGARLWRHTEVTSWDVQGTLEAWEGQVQDLVATVGRSIGSRKRARVARGLWPRVVAPTAAVPPVVQKRLGDALEETVAAARDGLVGLIGSALNQDAARFRSHLHTDEGLILRLSETVDDVAALLRDDSTPERAATGSDTHPEPDDA